MELGFDQDLAQNSPQVFTPYNFSEGSDDAPVPAKLNNQTPWPAKLPFDLALGLESQDDLCLKHSVDPLDFDRWTYSEAFRRAVAVATREIKEQGITFKRLCSSIAEDFLPELDNALHSAHIAFGTKLDAFKTITKLAGLEVQSDKDKTGGSPQVNIQINL